MAEIPPEEAVPEGYEFALCLTHDVDRPYKTYQALYYALTERDPTHLASLLPGRNPYWQFEDAMAIEDEFGVRSAWYFLDEQHLFRDRPIRDWLDPTNWKRYLGRYSVLDPAIREVIGKLAAGGWEVGLHGSFESYRNPARLRLEKAVLDGVLAAEIGNGTDGVADVATADGGATVLGGRQHYLNLDVPDTWRSQRAVGLRYDSSLGENDSVGFGYGYGLRQPFDDAFVVFPLTAMELALPDPGEDFAAAWRVVSDLLDEARDHGAVMTVLWHPRMFAEGEFPGYRRLYRRLLAEAQAMDAWIGPPGDCYERLDHPTGDDSGMESAALRNGDRRSRRLTKADREEVATE